LHDLLTYAQQNGLDDVLSWVHNGSAFMVHDQQQLLKILPIFFGQTKFRSFQRQLNVSIIRVHLGVLRSKELSLNCSQHPCLISSLMLTFLLAYFFMLTLSS
jgi:hypothetical protein